MKPLAALAALTIAVATTVAPAFAARSSYVVDDAHMLSPAAIAQIDQQVSALNAESGKEVVVITAPSLDGATVAAAAERAFAQQQVNGVEIYIAKAEKKIEILGDRASRQFFPPGSFTTIYQAMRSSFNTGNVDQGVETGVSLIINTYRGHESSLRNQRVPVGAGGGVTHSSNSGGGFSMGWIWWIIILAVIFFIIRGIFRAMSGPRMMPPGYGGPGYGGPGYGGGMGMGGGGFWSGLLGGLGGAFLGNELFGGNRNFGGGEGGGYGAAGVNDPGQSADASGWQSDAGQADTSNAGGGGWGDSGGGGGGWGGGDGGGGGGDGGGGGGDGGGW